MPAEMFQAFVELLRDSDQIALEGALNTLVTCKAGGDQCPLDSSHIGSEIMQVKLQRMIV